MTKTSIKSESQARENGPSASFPSWLTREQLAPALGVTLRTVTNWVRAGIPRKDVRYHLPTVVEWLIDREATRRTRGKSAPDGDTLAAYRIEKTRLVRLRYLRERGKLLPKDEMIRAFTDRAFEFGRALLTLGRRFSAKVAAKCKTTVREVEAIHEREARKILEDYARPIEIKEEKPVSRSET